VQNRGWLPDNSLLTWLDQMLLENIPHEYLYAFVAFSLRCAVMKEVVTSIARHFSRYTNVPARCARVIILKIFANIIINSPDTFSGIFFSFFNPLFLACRGFLKVGVVVFGTTTVQVGSFFFNGSADRRGGFSFYACWGGFLVLCSSYMPRGCAFSF
jgi:hypothetical protein